MMLFVLAAGAAATAETALFIWTGAIGGIIIYLVLFSVVWRNIFVRTQARIFPSAGTGSASATGGGRLPPTGLR
jgi:membrane protein implicated in regulation of membrane protease activity